MASLTQSEVTAFQKNILDNFHESGRKFPWRETRNPYHILVSEMMLQQTQTERVIPKYLEWLSVFPTLESLSNAPFSQVLEYWVGLGYNRRARFLHETCKIICTKYNGIFPEDPELLDALPGIGPYTARAIATFAFGLPHVFIETNIRAVYIFFFFTNHITVSDAEIIELIAQTVYSEDPRAWYYALMDYGSTLKKKIHNPNRKSLHYTKQSKFDGSIRQARGSIIRFLSAHKHATLNAISIADSIDYDKIEKAAEDLLAEELVCETNGIYRISGEKLSDENS